MHRGGQDGASGPGMKGENERLDYFQLFINFWGSQSLKTASFQTLKPENIRFSPCFPHSPGAVLLPPLITDDIHVTKCNSAPIIEHHWCSFLPVRPSYLGIQESTYNFSGPFAGFPSSARPLDARAAQGSVLGTVLYLHSP